MIKLRQSYLETCIEILNFLAQNSSKPKNVKNIISKELKDRLFFLVNQGLVEEWNNSAGNVVYVLTQRGTNVLRYFRKFDLTLPNIENKDSYRK